MERREGVGDVKKEQTCKGKSTDPYKCTSGLKMGKNEICDWKSYGLLGTLGKGLRILVIADWIKSPIVDEIFMPISYIEKEKGKTT